MARPKEARTLLGLTGALSPYDNGMTVSPLDGNACIWVTGLCEPLRIVSRWRPIQRKEPTVKLHPCASNGKVTVNIEHAMTEHDMQLVLSRVHAIAVGYPHLGEFAASLEHSVRKLVEARLIREHAGQNDTLARH